MEMSLLRLVFYGIPESIALMTLAFAIAGARFDWKRIIFFGTLVGCAAFVIRLVPITFGVHTLVIIGLMIFFLSYIQRIDLTRSIISVLITMLILISSEAVARTASLSVFNLSMEEVMKNEFLITVTGIPEIFLIFIIAFLIKKFIFKDVAR